MADLVSILSSAGMGLSAHRAATATASHNIQNVNTPGYSRQRAELQALGAEFVAPNSFIGLGVELGKVTQSRDRFVEAQLTTVLGSEGRSAAHARSLESVHAINPDADGGITHSIANFYAAARALGQNPGDLGLRQAFVGASRQVANSFKTTAASIEGPRTGLDAQLQTKLLAVNNAAANLADLNRRIGALAPGAPNDLLDSRQLLVDELATLTGAVPIPDATGHISMALPTGIALVSGTRSAVLSTVGDASNRGHLNVRVTLADGSGPITATAERLGGELRGMLEARDGALKTASEQVDQLAFDFTTAVNTLHRAGRGLGSETGNDLFNQSLTPAGAAAAMFVMANIIADPRLVAAATSNPTYAGDDRNIQAIIATEAAALTGGLNVGQTVAKIVSDFGATTYRARAEADHDGAMRTQLETMRESVSGVSIDEEMINLTKSQRAYEALLKVITTADQMLETLMKIR